MERNYSLWVNKGNDNVGMRKQARGASRGQALKVLGCYAKALGLIMKVTETKN